MTFTELAAWQQIVGTRLLPWEARVLRHIHQKWLNRG